MEGKKWYPFPSEECAGGVDCCREIIHGGVNLCTVDVHALVKGYTEVDVSVDDCADCFDLSNTRERCESVLGKLSQNSPRPSAGKTESKFTQEPVLG